MSTDEQPWTLARIYADLGSKTEVAEALDVTLARFRKWLERSERIRCPQPVRVIGNVKIYSIVEWQGWYARWMSTRGGWKTKPFHDGRVSLLGGSSDTEKPT